MANRKDPKASLSALEKKLLECNLFENGKATVFAKPHSQKGLQQKCAAFSSFAPVRPPGQTLSRFPAWCQAAYVPAHYRNIEKLVSGPSGIDGSRVSALLLSSGLPTPVLGKIWELCSRTLPGTLTQQELYAALALVALAQAGYPAVLEVLFQLPQPPLPAFAQQATVNGPRTWSSATCYTVPPNHHPPVPTSAPAPQHAATVNPGLYPVVSSPNVPNSAKSLPVPAVRNSTESAKPAVWCSEVTRRLDDANPGAAARQEAPSIVPTSSSSNRGDHVEVEDFDDFDDFVSAAAVPVESVEAPRKGDAFGTHAKQEAGDCGRNVPHAEDHVVTSGGDAVDVRFEGLGPSTVEFKFVSTGHVEKRRPPSNRLPRAAGGGLKSTEDAKPFRFTIDVSALTSSKPSKPQRSERVDSSAAEKTEDEFADFQRAFPQTNAGSGPACTEDKYGAFKEIFELSTIRWDAPAKPEDKSWFAEAGHPAPSLLEADDGDEFGDFCHVTAPSLPPVQSTLPVDDPRPSEIVKKNPPSQDAGSLGDRLSVYSLELGGRNGSSPSHHGSVLSLELRMGNSDDDDSPRPASADETASAGVPSDTQEDAASLQMGQPVLFLDKYSVIREVSQQSAKEEDREDEWAACLRSVAEVLATAGSFFGRESSSQICREALSTEEGANYIRNVVEVYKVCRRIELSSRLTGKRTGELEELCRRIRSLWEDLSSFLENSCLFSVPRFPEGDATWLPESTDSSKSCGICLLHVDNPEIAASKLSYGAREYHAPCANLWVNCVGSLLPSIPYPDLL